jgi:hypothetical protein
MRPRQQQRPEHQRHLEPQQVQPAPPRRLGVINAAPGVVERFCRRRLRRGIHGRHRQPPTRADSATAQVADARRPSVTQNQKSPATGKRPPMTPGTARWPARQPALQPKPPFPRATGRPPAGRGGRQAGLRGQPRADFTHHEGEQRCNATPSGYALTLSGADSVPFLSGVGDRGASQGVQRVGDQDASRWRHLAVCLSWVSASAGLGSWRTWRLRGARLPGLRWRWFLPGQRLGGTGAQAV